MSCSVIQCAQQTATHRNSCCLLTTSSPKMQHTYTQCNTLQQCVNASCSVLCCVAVCVLLQRVAVCCSVLQCVAACCSVLQCVAPSVPRQLSDSESFCNVELRHRALRSDALASCCSVLQSVIVCCKELQCVAVCCSE